MRFLADPGWTTLVAPLSRRPFDLRGEQPAWRGPTPRVQGFDPREPLRQQVEPVTCAARAGDLDVGTNHLVGRLRAVLSAVIADVASWPRKGALPAAAESADDCARALAEGLPAGLCALLRDTVARRLVQHTECVAAWRDLVRLDAPDDDAVEGRLPIS